ncbi:MAG: hypothetical protein MUC36_15825 [Planctomycetes bacterium]|jgi:hypothetical protein|nr:hypothetical protein [Planctomycetota bacterium]
MSRLQLLLATVLLFLCSPLSAQDPATVQFRNDFNKGIELADDKLIDKAVKRGPHQALNYYESVYWDKQAGKAEGIAKVDALAASWKRCFEGSETIDKLERWLNGADKGMQDALRKSRDQSYKLWVQYTDVVSKALVKADYLSVMQDYLKLAQNAQQFGHYLEVAELYSFASIVGSKMPDKTIDDRKAVVEAIDGFAEARKAWNYAFDEHFIRNTEFAKSEKQRIEEDQKKGDKKKADGYSADAKGVEALVMPGVAGVAVPLKFEALTNWDELDYGPKGGPVPAFWWQISLAKEGSAQEIAWFKRSKLYLVRAGAAKFALSLAPNDTKDAIEVDAGSKGKVTSFWLDGGRKVPYAMAFWLGTDRELINESEGNFAPSDTLANVYYRSAASWKGQIGADTVTLYDDNANGNPGDVEPLAGEFKSYTLGDPTNGTVVPMLDSMRVGKGPRVPHSEFVKLSTGWHHVKKASGDDVTVRPFNPEYLKTGKIKLVWSGPKPTAPAQLVVQGVGDLRTAFFDVAGGKEVEVPAGEYAVIFGRLVIGKAPRVQTANLFQGQSRSFAVEAGKTYELRMGAPFALQFERTGEDTVVIPAMKVFLGESSGCVFTDYHGMSVACDVAMAKEGDGKGARSAGKFLRFTNWDLVNEAVKSYPNAGLMVACFPMPDGYRSGPLELKVKLPQAGMKLQLSIKKHPVFGEVKSLWQ